MRSGERIVIKGREYRIDALLSTDAGSYGQVWAATDPSGRAVALKFINADAMLQADLSLHGHWHAHLEREIHFLDSLNAAQSRHIVALLDHDRLDGQPVLVLERLQANLGQWLSQLRRDDAPPPDLAQILDWTEQILDGLDVIHRAGFVYRDLKFSNILVGERGALLKLADFGSLKREDGDSTRSCIGTPATMAPEQILPVRQGENGCEYAVDHRADYYALGLLLFALLTEQSATAAQRRLGQLLALHGQEGAGKHRDELGGLTDGERELLRHAIEFWTVPARPEQRQRGAATLLIDLLTRLLAGDPATRPASSAEIRTILEAVRADQPAIPLALSDRLEQLPDTPPNRHPRRSNTPTRFPWSKRTIGLIGVAGLVGTLAWATIIRPAFHQEQTQPPGVAFVPEPSPAAPSPALATESAAPAPSEPSLPSEPPDNENPVATTVPDSKLTKEQQATAVEPPATSASETPENVVTDTTPSTPTDSSAEPLVEAEPPAPPTTESVTESITESGTESGTETSPNAPGIAVTPSQTKPVASPPTPKLPSSTADAPRKTTAPAITERSRPNRPPKQTAHQRTVKAASPTVETAEKSSSVAPRSTNQRTVKAAPPTVETAEKSSDVAPRPTNAAEPPVPTTSRPVVKSPTKTTSIVKVAPKPPEPAAQSASARHPTPEEKTAAVPHADKAITRVVRERPAPHTDAAPKTASSNRRPPALAPIELVSRPNKETPSTPPPIELVSRTNPRTATPDRAPPPIMLVSRSNPSPSTTPTRSTSSPAVATAAPSRNPTASPPKPPVRSTDPITDLRKDAGRAANDIRREAQNVGNWVGHTSASVGTEIQRGFDSANRAINGWMGNCNSANGCRSTRQIERRDRWSRNARQAMSSPPQRRSPPDDGDPGPPPRQRWERGSPPPQRYAEPDDEDPGPPP
jgi:serine/threonine-protein kinase